MSLYAANRCLKQSGERQDPSFSLRPEPVRLPPSTEEEEPCSPRPATAASSSAATASSSSSSSSSSAQSSRPSSSGGRGGASDATSMSSATEVSKACILQCYFSVLHVPQEKSASHRSVSQHLQVCEPDLPPWSLETDAELMKWATDFPTDWQVPTL